jgi:hypothetical protein
MTDGADNFEHEQTEDGAECGADGELIRTLDEPDPARGVYSLGDESAEVPDGAQPLHVGDRVTWDGPAEDENLLPTPLLRLHVWTVTDVFLTDGDRSDGPLRWMVHATRADRADATVHISDPADRFHRLPAMPEQHRVFTFGYDHRHPDTDARLGYAYVRIPGDAELARARMLALFGREWAFDYDSERFAPLIERYRLVEVAPPLTLAGLADGRYALPEGARTFVHGELARDALATLATDLRFGPGSGVTATPSVFPGGAPVLDFPDGSQQVGPYRPLGR